MDILTFYWTFYLNHFSPLWGYFLLFLLLFRRPGWLAFIRQFLYVFILRVFCARSGALGVGPEGMDGSPPNKLGSVAGSLCGSPTPEPCSWTDIRVELGAWFSVSALFRVRFCWSCRAEIRWNASTLGTLILFLDGRLSDTGPAVTGVLVPCGLASGASPLLVRSTVGISRSGSYR